MNYSFVFPAIVFLRERYNRKNFQVETAETRLLGAKQHIPKKILFSHMVNLRLLNICQYSLFKGRKPYYEIFALVLLYCPEAALPMCS